MSRETAGINFEKVIIARKLSVLEYEARELGISQAEMLEHYKNTGSDWETILASHNRQREALSELEKALPGIKIQTGFQLRPEAMKDLQAVIALGGDDHYQYVSHFLENQLLIPINSDTQKSDGALSDFTVSTFIDELPRIKNGEFDIESWTRLQVDLNGQRIPELAISQIFIGAVDNEDMSRYSLNYRGQNELQKSSGLIIATGTGSTGWYDAAVRYLKEDGEKFDRTEKKAVFVSREPFNGRFSNLNLKSGEFFPDEKLIITSLMNKPAKVGIDALVRRDFPRGSVVEIKISDSPLSVLRKELI
jgi:NAD kinase